MSESLFLLCRQVPLGCVTSCRLLLQRRTHDWGTGHKESMNHRVARAKGKYLEFSKLGSLKTLRFHRGASETRSRRTLWVRRAMFEVIYTQTSLPWAHSFQPISLTTALLMSRKQGELLGKQANRKHQLVCSFFYTFIQTIVDLTGKTKRHPLSSTHSTPGMKELAVDSSKLISEECKISFIFQVTETR